MGESLVVGWWGGFVVAGGGKGVSLTTDAAESFLAWPVEFDARWGRFGSRRGAALMGVLWVRLWEKPRARLVKSVHDALMGENMGRGGSWGKIVEGAWNSVEDRPCGVGCWGGEGDGG